MDLNGHATEAANDLHKTKGFGAFPIAILIPFLQTLFQYLLNCMQPDPVKAEEHTREYVKKRWSVEKGYDRPLMRRTMVQARRAAKKHKLGKLNEAQQEEAAIAALDRARLGTGFGNAISEALALAEAEDE